MKKIQTKIFSCLLVGLLLFVVGCKTENIDTSKVFLKNEIISYEPFDTNKIVINVCNGMNANTEPLEKVLEERFPEIEIITEIGTGYDYLQLQAENKQLADIIFYAFQPEFSKYFYDLSSLTLTERYNFTSLEAVSVDNRIYQLPVASSGTGIFYNKTLFEEKKWSVPQTLDEFYELCEKIQAEGIRPFAPCFKYAATVADVGLGLCNREVFGSINDSRQFYEFTSGNRSSTGVMEPFLEALKGLYEKGLITADDFSSSTTQNRMKMYQGKVAMIPYSLNFISLYDTEQPECEIGFMGYPTDVPGEHYMALSNEEVCISLSRESMKDSKKSEILLEILDFLSTNEGQEVMFQCYTGVSSLKTYQSAINLRFDEIIECIEESRIYFPQQIWSNDDLPIIKEWVTTDMDMAEMLTNLDKIVETSLLPRNKPEAIATVTEEFSIMETAAFMADAFRETTNADIGLVLYKTPYRGILMKLFKGELTDPSVFYLRGIGSNNCLTVYEITGENLKLLLEHPYIGDTEYNAMYVPSGLKITYAPWNEMNNNVISVTLADGTPIEDNKVYQVSAWETTIDDRYISRVVNRYEEHNDSVAYMTNIIKNKLMISPTHDDRIILKWE